MPSRVLRSTLSSSAPRRGTRIVGIDPGSRLCGWGIVDVDGMKLVHVDNGVLVLDESLGLPLRLQALFDRLGAVLETHRPDSAAMEGVFQHRNARSALVLGHARGVALLVLSRAGLEIGEYTPQQVKKAASGTGRAEKSQIQQVVTRRLDLPEPPQEDAADALAVALCHAQHLAFPAAVSLPPRPSRRAGHRRSEAALRALVLAQSKPTKPGGPP